MTVCQLQGHATIDLNVTRLPQPSQVENDKFNRDSYSVRVRCSIFIRYKRHRIPSTLCTVLDTNTGLQFKIWKKHFHLHESVGSLICHFDEQKGEENAGKE